jgi:ubiquinone/menaquinone biosynthesis C-methylase UbiE
LPIELKGLWNKEVFKNSNPIVLELACGKADYTLGLAKIFRNLNTTMAFFRIVGFFMIFIFSFHLPFF